MGLFQFWGEKTCNKHSFGQENPFYSIVHKNRGYNKETHLQDSSHFISKTLKKSGPGASAQIHQHKVAQLLRMGEVTT